MVDIFTVKSQTAQGTIARLKVSSPEAARVDTGLTNAEKRLSDILDLSPEAIAKVQGGRKVSAHLDLFGSVLKFLNGFKSSHRPQFSKVEVEFFIPKKK